MSKKDLKNKKNNVQYYRDIMLNRALTIFHYVNLPGSLQGVELEQISLRTRGYIVITKYSNNIVSKKDLLKFDDINFEVKQEEFNEEGGIK